ncbi:hypothetical protein HANVADRAFT_51385 [Hanseniaspora valbyensis NRRL Y-1626]|uniref:PH domain-containing protein n=1 Tax=Hanseniaspora valbyensis NRRL Y-1626 TaxID=766949 RepID=A0A1B7TI89_9ASCO|nr:hypothetical protein HANVADRAFT_51385 [Hanseniaspora valbyensis NRRL Y-1626]
MSEQIANGSNSSMKNENIGDHEDSNYIKRKKSIKNLLSKKENLNSEQLEQLLFQNKQLQDQLDHYQTMTEGLKEELIEKNQEIFIDKSNNVVLSPKTYNELINNNVNQLTKDELCSIISERFNLKTMSHGEYQILSKPMDESSLTNEASQLGFKILDRQEYDFMKSKIESPDDQTIKRTVAKMGLKLLNSQELDHLKNPTRTEMEKKLKTMGLTIVSETARNSMIESTGSDSFIQTTPPNNNNSARNSAFYSLKNTSKTSLNSSRVLASRDFFEQVIKDENSGKDVVLEAGRSLGFVRLSQEQYKKLLDGQKEKVLTKTDIYSGAKDFQLTVLPNDEYKQLLKNKKNRQSLSFSDLNEYASRFKLRLIPDNGDNSETNGTPSPQNTPVKMDSRGSRMMSHVDSVETVHFAKKNSNNINNNSKDLTLEDVQSWCNNNKYRLSELSLDEEIKKYATSSNLNFLSIEEYNSLLAKSNNTAISLEQVKEYVQNNNLKLLPQQQYDSLKALKDGKTIKDYTKNEITTHLQTIDPQIHITTKQLVLDLNKKIKSLEEKELTLDEVKAKFPDQQILNSEQIADLQKIAKQDITLEEVNAKFPDFTIMHNDEFDAIDLKLQTASNQKEKTLNLEDIKKEVNEKHSNHVLLSKEDFDSLNDKIKELSNKTLVLQKGQYSKPTTVEEIERELEQIDPTHIVVNKEDMFKALEDKTVTYEELLDIVNEQYPESAIVDKTELETMKNKLSSALETTKSLTDISAHLEKTFPDSIIVNKKEYETNLQKEAIEPNSIEEIKQIIESNYPENIIVDKSSYESQLQDLATELQKNSLLMEKLDHLEKNNVDLTTELDSLKDVVNQIGLPEGGNRMKVTNHDAILEQLQNFNDIDFLYQLVEAKNPDIMVVNKVDHEKLIQKVEEQPRTESIGDLQKLIEQTYPENTIVEKAVYESTIEQIEDEQLKKKDLKELVKIVEEYHPESTVVDKIQYETVLQTLADELEKQQSTNIDSVPDEKTPVAKSIQMNEQNLQSINDPNSITIQKEKLESPDFIKEHAENIGLSVISAGEMAEISEHFTHLGKQQIQLDELKQLAEVKFDSKIVTIEEYEELKRDSDVDLDVLNQTAEEFGLALISNEEFERLNQKDRELNTNGDIYQQGKVQEKNIFIEEEEKEMVEHKEDKQIIQSEDKKIITSNNNKNADDEPVPASSEITLETLGETATAFGLAIVSRETYEQYQNYDIYQEADKLGLKLISLEDYDELINDKQLLNEINSTEIEPQSDEQENDDSSSFNFNDNSDTVGSSGVLHDKFVALAAKNNLTVIPTTVYKEMLQSPILTKELLVQRARDFDMIAIDLQQFTEITKANMKQKETVQDLLLKVQDIGYVPVTKSDYESLTNPTKDYIANLAYNQWNMVLVERNNSLLVNKNPHMLGSSSRINSSSNDNNNNNSSNSNKQHNSLIQIQPPMNRDISINNGMNTSSTSMGEENGPYLFQPFQHARNRSINTSATKQPFNLIEEAKKQSMLLIPESMYLKDLHQIPPVSGNGNDNGLLLVERVQLEQILNEKQEYPSLLPPVEEVVSGTNQSRGLVNQTVEETQSINTTQTSGGFSNDKIIVSLTQTVIGEYLYKYYNKFGVFSKQRHERYFWIHPFTMTLYWSVKNPSKDNNKNLMDNKTKGVSIVGVEIVNDPNPYPPGLYNKSIVILTKDGKNVKITCPTMQRHKVWLRSLRYLQNAANSNVLENLNNNNNNSNSNSNNVLDRNRNISRVPSASNHNNNNSNNNNNQSFRNNYHQNYSGNNRFVSNDYSNNMNQKISPEVEQHPTFFVNSLK